MDKSEYLEFSSREDAKIYEFKRELKETKLGSFFIELLANNELDYINQIIHKEIKFYEEVNALTILKKSIKDISDSLSREFAQKSIEHIRKIENQNHEYIKEIFFENLIKNIQEIEERQYTPAQLQGSGFHQKTFELGLELLAENPHYVKSFKILQLEEYKKLIQLIELSNKLPAKNISGKKTKI